MTVTDKSGQEKTTEWFLNKISDFTLELEETIKATRAITENDQPVTLALSTQNSDKLKGFITVKGPSIVKGDLKIKLSNYNRGHTMNKVVDSSKPILLQQIKTAQNCLSMALFVVSKIDTSLIHVMIHKLKHIIALSQQAQKGLLFMDPKFLFPKVHQSYAPGLLADCHIDYAIQGTNIITTVSLLQFPDSNPLEQVLSQFKNVNVVEIDGRVVHVVDKITISAALPCLNELETGLGVIEELCADFIRKYNTLF